LFGEFPEAGAMVEKISRDDTRDDDAIYELSRKLPKSFSLSLSLSLSRKQRTNERKRRRRKRDEKRRRRERDGEDDEGVVSSGRVKNYFNTEQTSVGGLPGLAVRTVGSS
jgi:hypothetical protein